MLISAHTHLLMSKIWTTARIVNCNKYLMSQKKNNLQGDAVNQNMIYRRHQRCCGKYTCGNIHDKIQISLFRAYCRWTHVQEFRQKKTKKKPSKDGCFTIRCLITTRQRLWFQRTHWYFSLYTSPMSLPFPNFLSPFSEALLRNQQTKSIKGRTDCRNRLRIPGSDRSLVLDSCGSSGRICHTQKKLWWLFLPTRYEQNSCVTPIGCSDWYLPCLPYSVAP